MLPPSPGGDSLMPTIERVIPVLTYQDIQAAHD